MKILAIRGKNLASLTGEFEIDFRSEPLRSAGLFAITGSTGSGKSTILDAMCIALYEKTPRLESIKDSEAIERHGEKGIFENDAKTILSKGCHTGYAEVEFLAVDNKEYRVRLTISRAGDKVDGNFRKTAYDLFNLTDGTHNVYKTKEYKALIPTLVGLTYEEFTRAVLLSQGNFAAFLKAPEKEKAAILQKLTGTEIYSRISAMIYSRYSDARHELELIENQIKDIERLSPEEKEELYATIDELDRFNKENELMLARLAMEKQWIERHTLLERELAEAERVYRTALSLKEQNRPVAEKLKRIDSVQEIRDTYMQRASTAEQLKENCKALALLKGSEPAAAQVLADTVTLAKQAEELTAKIQSEYDTFKPRLKEAIKIEEQIKGCESRLKENCEARKRSYEEREKLVQSIQEEKKRLEECTEESNGIEQWFSERKEYEKVVPNIPVILSNMRVIADTRMQIEEQEKRLTATKAMLADNEKRLAEAKTKEEELAGTLSKEIAELRSRLVEGEPCPVCGSRNHHITRNGQKTLAETELEKARECVRKSIELLTQCIESHKNDITRLQSGIDTLGTSIATLTANCIALLESIERREEIITGKNAVKELSALANSWESKSKRLVAIKEEVAVKSKGIEISLPRVNELTGELAERDAVIEALYAEIEENRKQLATMLGEWKNREEAERHFEKAVTDANKAFAEAVEKKSTAASNYSKLKGSIEEMEKLVKAQGKIVERLSLEIGQYLAERTDNMSKEELDELLSPENDVAKMRRQSEEVTKALLNATATLDERKRNLEEHLKATAKPEEEKTMGDVLEAMEKALARRSELTEKKSAVNATLLKDKENNERYSKYRDLHESKQKTAEDWCALNAVFGSANGDKLTRLTQGYTLDILLDVANIHLKEFSGRYMLSRISQESLGIKVIDLEMMSDSRSVHSLSGGETFLASLALSLALSSVSSNKMNIESLFIDEGFGALDGDTLKEAIDVLEKLQGKGRKIGVISHLSDMLERIPTRIRVVKKGNGKSRIITE